VVEMLEFTFRHLMVSSKTSDLKKFSRIWRSTEDSGLETSSRRKSSLLASGVHLHAG
jgi:hypothetical protein